MAGCVQGCTLTPTPDASPVQGALLAWDGPREPVLYSEKPMCYIEPPDIQMVLMLLKVFQGKRAIERDNLVLNRWDLQCHVVLKPDSWDVLSAGLGETPCCAGVHRRAMLHLSSDLLQLLLCPSRVLHVELHPVNSLIWAQEDVIPTPRVVYLSPSMEIWAVKLITYRLLVLLVGYSILSHLSSLHA